MLLLAAACLAIGALGFDESNLHSEDFYRAINANQSEWVSGKNFEPGSFAKNLLSALPLRDERLPARQAGGRVAGGGGGGGPASAAAASFDARREWRRCGSIGRVREQGNCASAWALAPAAALTDRTCVAEKRAEEVSAQNVLSCCKACGTNCYGGYVTDALRFLAKRGSVSGRCHPYEMFPCQKLGALNCPRARALAPRCRINCRRTYGRRPFQDLRRASAAYSLPAEPEAIRAEIAARGPVVALVDVYEDFLTYKSGVYRRVAGRLLAHHPLKLVGWGGDGGDHWLAVNSWSAAWGDRGLVKIAVGSAGVNLENRVFAVDH